MISFKTDLVGQTEIFQVFQNDFRGPTCSLTDDFRTDMAVCAFINEFLKLIRFSQHIGIPIQLEFLDLKAITCIIFVKESFCQTGNFSRGFLRIDANRF